MLGITCLLVTFLTELTSNVTTVEILLPILGALAIAIKIHPLFLMVPATISCSFAFMLPVATPPNAIVFATNRIQTSEMAKVGVLLNLLCVFLVTIATLVIGKIIFPELSRSETAGDVDLPNINVGGNMNINDNINIIGNLNANANSNLSGNITIKKTLSILGSARGIKSYLIIHFRYLIYPILYAF